MAGGSNPNPITIVGDHSGETSGVHGVGASDVESVDGAQSKADAAESAAKTYADDNRYTDADASAAAPVQSVNGNTGDVTTEGGLWTEDANSPQTTTGATASYTLAQQFDIIHVSVKVPSAGGQSDINVTANGVTSGYDVYNLDGGFISGYQFVQLANFDGYGAIEFVMAGRWGSLWTCGRANPLDTGLLHVAGDNGGITSPLTDFTVEDGLGNADEITLEVRGRDIA